jgi:hypothetical protein
MSIKELKECGNVSTRVSGVVSSKRHENNEYFVELEDGRTDIVLKCQKQSFDKIKENDVVVCEVDKNNQVYNCNDISLVKDEFADQNLKLVLKLEDPENIDSLKDVFDMYNGNHEVIIVVVTEYGKVMLETMHKVRINESLLEELEEIVGVENMALRKK